VDGGMREEEEAGEEGVKEDEGENAVSTLISLDCVIASEKRSRGESLLAVASLLIRPSNMPKRSSSCCP